MKIIDINDQLQNMNVDEKTKKSIIKIIDLKTESDMEKILQKMDIYNQKMDIANQMMAEKLTNSEKIISKELKIVYWVIGISGIMITIALAILAFKK